MSVELTVLTVEGKLIECAVCFECIEWRGNYFRDGKNRAEKKLFGNYLLIFSINWQLNWNYRS